MPSFVDLLDRSGSRPRGQTAARAVLIAGLLWVIAACSENDVCERAENADYPQLEDVTEALFDGVEVTYERLGTCFDTGDPHAVLHATVMDWQSPKDAVRFLDDHGWVRQDFRSYSSPDGTYEADIGIAEDPTGRFIVVHFELPRA